MCKNKETIHYCTILSAEQWIFLLEGKFSVDRYKCLYRLMTEAVRTKTTYTIKGIQITLEVGQVAASDVELAAFMGCNRKTIGKLIDSFNKFGMLTTKTNNRTSVHTLHFLTGWYVDGVLLTNPHYVRPSAITKGQTGNVRTPVFGNSPSEGKLPDNSPNKRQNTDSMATGTPVHSSSLCSSVISDNQIDEQDANHFLPPPDWYAENESDCLPVTNKEDRPFGEDNKENPGEAQDGMTDDS